MKYLYENRLLKIIFEVQTGPVLAPSLQAPVRTVIVRSHRSTRFGRLLIP